MKKILIIFFILNITTLLFAEPDFRKVNWGDSMEHVRNTETGVFNATKSAGSQDILVYDIVIAYLKVQVGYLFAYDKLVQAAYLFVEDYGFAMNLYIDDSERINDLLKGKFGAPAKKSIQWLEIAPLSPFSNIMR